jgi:Ca2+-binding EF-hand superfamily protein
MISQRLFAVYDTDKNGYLDILEFMDGMLCLFTEGYDRLANFIFKLYDFDKDDLISKEDVRTVLSYVPLNTKNVVSNFRSKFEK